MSKPVNDVRSTSFDQRYAGVTFSGGMRNALKQARAAPDHGLPDEDIRAPRHMSRDRAMLLGFLRLLPESPLKLKHGQPFAILSAEHSGNRVNDLRTRQLRNELTEAKARFASVTGSYKGTEENGFVVLLESELTYQLVVALGARWQQESVLLVDANRRAVLHYFDGAADKHIGTWTPVNDVTGHDAWTRDAAGQQYTVLSQHSKYSLAYAMDKGFVTYKVQS